MNACMNHFNNYVFNENWFANLDLIMSDSKLLDLSDIKIIKKMLIDKLNYTSINDVNYQLSRKNIEYLPNNWEQFGFFKICQDMECCKSNDIDIVLFFIKNDHKINWVSFSQNTHDVAVKHCIMNSSKINWPAFSQNTNDLAVEFCIKNIHLALPYFALNCNDTAVNYLIKNPDKIDWDMFSYNPNIRAMKFCIKNKINGRILMRGFYSIIIKYKTEGTKIHPDMLNLHNESINVYLDEDKNNINDVEFLSKFDNDRCIDICKQNKMNINTWNFSSHNNDNSVQFCIDNPEIINWSSFSRNINDKAVKCCIDNINKIDWRNFQTNTNPMAVNFCMDKLENKVLYFSLNESNLAVEHLKKNPNLIAWDEFNYNNNIEARKLCIQNGWCVPFEYIREKLLAIKKLKWMSLTIEHIIRDF